MAGSEFETLLLKDDQATEQATLEAVANFVRQASSEDSLILALAGHGFVDSGTYQFALHDCKFDASSKGALSLTEIEQLVSQCPARRRVVMLDTCHSGSELPGAKAAADSNDPIQFKNRSLGVSSTSTTPRQERIRKQMLEQFGNQVGMSGTTVISASNAGQFALESADWNNGAFTFAVRQAIRSKSADFDSNGKISVQELAKFVEDFVAKLTDGRQKPEARFLNSALDTNLVVAREAVPHTVEIKSPHKDKSPSLLEIDPSGQYAAVTDKNIIRLVNLETGTTEIWNSNSKEPIRRFRFSKDSHSLVTWYHGGRIDSTCLVSGETTNLVPDGGGLSDFLLSEDLSLGVRFESFGKQLVTFRFTANGVESETVDTDEVRAIYARYILPDNQHLRVLADDVVKDIDLKTGQSTVVKEVDLGEAVFGDWVRFFDSGKRLIKYGKQGDQLSRQLVWINLESGEVQKAKPSRFLAGIRFNGKNALFDRLGEFILTSPARERFLFDIQTKSTVDKFSLDIGPDEDFQLSNDNRYAAVFRKPTAWDAVDRGIRVYSLVTGKEIAWLKKPSDIGFHFAFGNDNKKLYAVDRDWQLWSWEVSRDG